MVSLREYKSGWFKTASVAVGALELCGGYLLLTFTMLSLLLAQEIEPFPSSAVSVIVESLKICFTRLQ